jgi:P2-related tail formation protein
MILPGPIAVNPYYAALSQTIQQRYESLLTGNMIASMYDTVPESVLDTLAAENNMLGYWGWYWADTTQKKRNLLKNADLLKSTVGSSFAIIHALEMIGIPNAIVVERLGGIRYDGTHYFDGTFTYNGLSWATFKVLIPVHYYNQMNSDQLLDLEHLINTYKRLVCHLVAIEPYTPIATTLDAVC